VCPLLKSLNIKLIFPAHLSCLPWIWTQNVHPECRYISNILHWVTSQKTVFIVLVSLKCLLLRSWKERKLKILNKHYISIIAERCLRHQMVTWDMMTWPSRSPALMS
jgi:hypothetical protein